MIYFLNLLLLIVLLFFNALFVCMEFSAACTKHSAIAPLAKKSKKAKKALWAIENTTKVLATTALGIMFASLVMLNIAEPQIHNLFGHFFESFAGEYAEIISFAVALAIIMSLHIIFGEMVPKNIAIANSEKMLLKLVYPLYFFYIIFKPLVFLVNLIANAVLKLFKITPKSGISYIFSLKQVENIVRHSAAEGQLDDKSGTIRRSFQIQKRKVGSIAINLNRLITINKRYSYEKIKSTIKKSGFSRFIVINKNIPLGYIHIKDIITVKTKKAVFANIRPLFKIDKNISIEKAITLLTKNAEHIAFIEPDKIVFLEDILEILIGQIDSKKLS